MWGDLNVCVVETPEGAKHYVTILPSDIVFSKGLIPEAIVGVLLRPIEEGQPIASDAFARNSLFVQFLHDVIARHAAGLPACRHEAQRLGAGWIYIIDQRTKTPSGAVPPQDIIGALEARDGNVVPRSYQPNPNHRILSDDGFFRLPPDLHACLLRELQARMSPPSPP
jgi:hypothetical protein